MSDPKKQKKPAASAPGSVPPKKEDETPSTGKTPIPVWLFALLALLLFWSMTYLDRHAGGFNAFAYEPYARTNQLTVITPPRDTHTIAMALGKQKYDAACMLCHEPSGLGKPGQFPPLAGSEWVLEPGPNRVIRIPIWGLSGPITVKGQQWTQTMPPFDGVLTDEELAAVLTYIRNSWGNEAPDVTAEQIRGVREAEKRPPGRAWTADELLKITTGP